LESIDHSGRDVISRRPAVSFIRLRAFAAGLLVLLACSVAWAEDKPAAPARVTVLDGSSVWRVLYSWDAVQVQTKAGPKARRRKPKYRTNSLEWTDFRFMTQYPAAGWTRPDFDDAGWARQQFFNKPLNSEGDRRAGGDPGIGQLRQLALRGKFTVTDPAKVGPLRLTLGYRGGVVVHLNGQEVARSHMPKGAVAPGALAELCPKKAYLKPDGKGWSWWHDRATIRKECYPLRNRKIEGVEIPAKALRKGTNVLAVEIHATGFPEEFLDMKKGIGWSTCGLIELRLQAGKADGIKPNVVRPKGLRVWNTNPMEHVHNAMWGNPHDALRPVRLAGTRNGSFTGRVVVSSDAPIKGLKVEAAELIGPDKAVIPVESMTITYGVFGGAASGQYSLTRGRTGLYARREDGTTVTVPALVPVSKKTLAASYQAARKKDGLPPTLRDGAVQPIRITVNVPKDAKPGAYAGKLTISAEGVEPVEVPVEIDVADWALPGPKDFTYWCGLLQSPEGAGQPYDVTLWSDEHFKIIGKSFEQIAKLGTRVVLVPIAAKTEYGNEHSMVLWVKKGNGYEYDFSRVEKYLDVAIEKLGAPRFVVVGVWHFSEHSGRRVPVVSVLDPATKKITNIKAPKHGSPESEAFWRPALTGVWELLKKRGIEKTMLLGYKSDRSPSKDAVGIYHKIVPGAGWMAALHPPRGQEYLAYKGGKVPVMYTSNVWGCGDVTDPTRGRRYGWNFKYPVKGGLRTWLDRGCYDRDTLTRFRNMSESILLSGRPGQGQIGADFWPPKPKKGKRGPRSLYNRYPWSQNAGGGNKACTTNQLLYPSPGGPMPTLRFIMMQENIQACEARIFLERKLLAKTLPADLAKKVQAVLDERTRWHRLHKLGPKASIWWPYSGWEERTRHLYAACAEVAKTGK
jgi:glycosyl hydrolase family 123